VDIEPGFAAQAACSSPAVTASGVSVRKTVDDLRRQHFHHAVQEEWQEYELVDCAKHGQCKIRWLDSEQCQHSQPGQQPSGTLIVPDSEP
jgi:hypothetical protein